MNPAQMQVWLSATRPRTLPAAVAPVLVGSALACRAGSFDLAAATLCLGFALLVQIGTNFANDYHDFVKGADNAARVGPRRAVASGLIAPGTMKRATLGIFAAAFAVGCGLLPWGGPPLLVVGVLSIVAGYAYTGGPWPLGYHGLGDVFVFVFFGLVAVCATFFVQAGAVAGNAVLAAIPVGLLAANILVVNNYRDADTDRAAGKRTLVVRCGRRAARAQFALSHLAAATCTAVLAWRLQSWTALAPLLLVPLGMAHQRRLARRSAPLELIALLGDTGKLLALFALLLSAGLVIG